MTNFSLPPSPPSPRSPRFITFEGGEGAGKTTLIKQVELFFAKRKQSTIITREPGGSLFGDQIRRWLLNDRQGIAIGSKAELLLFLASRAQHIEELIAPSIDAGKIVLCDRFNDSTVAYQGAGRQLGVEWVRAICDLVCGSIIPDLTIYLDVDPKVGLERTKWTTKENASAGEIDVIEAETIEFHKRVREAFHAIAKAEPQRFHLIDAHQPQDLVFRDVMNLLTPYYESHV